MGFTGLSVYFTLLNSGVRYIYIYVFPPCYITIVTGSGGSPPSTPWSLPKPPRTWPAALRMRHAWAVWPWWSRAMKCWGKDHTTAGGGKEEVGRWNGTGEMVGNPTNFFLFFLGGGVGWKMDGNETWCLKNLWSKSKLMDLFFWGGEKQQYKYVCMVYFWTCLQ